MIKKSDIVMLNFEKLMQNYDRCNLDFRTFVQNNRYKKFKVIKFHEMINIYQLEDMNGVEVVYGFNESELVKIYK